VLAAIRPDSWNFPLLLHVFGAMVMVGALVLASSVLVFARRSDSPTLVRVSFRALLWAALPAWIVMRVAAEWVADKEGWSDIDDPPSWIDMGYSIAEPTVLLLIIATVLAGLAVRRAERQQSSQTLGRAAAALVGLAIVVSLVAVWAMTTKPT
jgi:heme A synthase